MQLTWSSFNGKLNAVVLQIIRVFNLIAILGIIFYLGEAYTGIAVDKVILIMGIIWSIVRGVDKDFITSICKTILKLDWGVSLILFGTITFIVWKNREDTITFVKNIMKKI